MQQPYRITKLGPDKDETLIYSREQAEESLKTVTERLKGKLTKHERAVKLTARATLLNVLGDPEFLPAAQEAFKFSRISGNAYIVACAMHMDGRYKEAIQYYKLAHDLPHDEGYKIDVSYASTFLVRGDWLNWHKQVRKLKQRAVYACYADEWRGEPTKKVSLIGEGGYGDIILHSRWYKALVDRGYDLTIYLADYFFTNQFLDLAYNQPWMPEIKPLVETPGYGKTIGVFDLPALWDTTPETLLPNLKWNASPEKIEKYKSVRSVDKLNVGICYSARSSEAPFVADGTYRSLTHDQVQKIVDSRPDINWVNLQYKPEWSPTRGIELVRDGWDDTAGLIENLDLVITVDTATMHLAAAMEKPTWVLLSGAFDAKFGLEGDTMPWYPTLRIFRNNAFGFDHAVDNLIAAITAPDLAEKL